MGWRKETWESRERLKANPPVGGGSERDGG